MDHCDIYQSLDPPVGDGSTSRSDLDIFPDQMEEDLGYYDDASWALSASEDTGNQIEGDTAGVNTRQSEIPQGPVNGVLDGVPAASAAVRVWDLEIIRAGASYKEASEVINRHLDRLHIYLENSTGTREELDEGCRMVKHAKALNELRASGSPPAASDCVASKFSCLACQDNGDICEGVDRTRTFQRTSASRGTFKRHFIEHHFPCPRWMCPVGGCSYNSPSKEFSRPERFRDHLKNKHFYENRILTEQQIEGLIISERTVLQNIPSSCLACGKVDTDWDEKKLADCAWRDSQQPVPATPPSTNSATHAHPQSEAGLVSNVAPTERYVGSTPYADQLIAGNLQPQSPTSQRNNPAASGSTSRIGHDLSQGPLTRGNRVQKAAKCAGCQHEFNNCDTCKNKKRRTKKCHNCPKPSTAYANPENPPPSSAPTTSVMIPQNAGYTYPNDVSFIWDQFSGYSGNIPGNYYYQSTPQHGNYLRRLSNGEDPHVHATFSMNLGSIDLYASCFNNLPMRSTTKHISKQLQKLWTSGDASEFESTTAPVTDLITQKEGLTLTTIETPQATIETSQTVFECNCDCRRKAQGLLQLDLPADVPEEQYKMDWEALLGNRDGNTLKNKIRKVMNLLRLKFIIQKEQKKQRQAMMRKVELAAEPAPNQKPVHDKGKGFNE